MTEARQKYRKTAGILLEFATERTTDLSEVVGQVMDSMNPRMRDAIREVLRTATLAKIGNITVIKDKLVEVTYEKLRRNYQKERYTKKEVKTAYQAAVVLGLLVEEDGKKVALQSERARPYLV